MADVETLTLRFRVDDRDLERSQRRTEGFGNTFGQLGVQVKKFHRDANRALAVTGIGLAAFTVSAVKAAAGFDATLRQLGAVTNVPKKGLAELSTLALKMGAATTFSAQQAADAMLALAKGGLSAAQIKAGALQATLTLAAAGGLQLGQAATFMANAMTSFGLPAERAADAAAALAGGANASTASVESLGSALQQVGPGARNAGLSLQDTVGVLAAFDNAGIKGSDAGTSLKTALANLIPTTSKARQAMADLGLKFEDAHGQILPITEIAQQLQDRLKGLSQAQRIQALQTIFGSDATRAATVLMNEGAAGIGKYIKATQDRAAAENLAKVRTEGAAGAFEQFSGAIETLKLTLGTALLPALTSLAKNASKLIGQFNALDRITGGFASKALVGAVGMVALGVGVFKVTRFVQAGRAAWMAYRTAKLANIAADVLLTRQQIALGLATTNSSTAATVAASRWAILGKTLGLAGIALTLAANANDLNAKSQSLGARIHANVVAPMYQKLGIYSAARVRQLQAETGGTSESGKAAKTAGQDTDSFVTALKGLGTQAGAASPKLSALTATLKPLKKEWNDQVTSVRESIEAYKGLITQSDVTADQVVKDLHNQVANFRTYAKDVKRLIKEGVSPAAIQELSKKGPEFVHALATGTNIQLERYKRFWKERGIEVRGEFAKSLRLQFADLAEKIKAMQAEINKLKGKQVKITATANINAPKGTLLLIEKGLAARGIKVPGRKAGGRITEGTGPTADDVLVRVSRGETIVPASASARPEFRSWAREQRIPGFRDGGTIGDLSGFRAGITRIDRDLREVAVALGQQVLGAMKTGLASVTSAAGDGTGPPAGSVGRSAQAILNFIRFADRLPYRLGAAGPSAYDCSGLVGEIWNRVTGNKSFVRRWTTNDKPWTTMGFIPISRNAGRFYEGNQSKPLSGRPHHNFMIGFRNGRPFGHTAGQFMGLAFEAANPRAGIRVGGNAAQIYSFPLLGYLPLADRKYRSKGFWQGGLLPPEPFVGIGTRTGQAITLNERGRERVVPAGRMDGGSGGVTQNINIYQQPGQDPRAVIAELRFRSLPGVA